MACGPRDDKERAGKEADAKRVPVGGVLREHCGGSTAVLGALEESYEGWAGVALARSGAPEGADLVLKRYPEPMAHGPEAYEPSHPCGSR